MEDNDVELKLNGLHEKDTKFLKEYFEEEKINKRSFGLELETEKVSPKVEEIIELIDISSNGEDFFNRMEDEFFD